MNHPTVSYRRRKSERGQSFLVIVIIVAVFLLGMMGVAVDYTQIWAHRQMAQAAADAACQAGAADLYIKAIDPSDPPSGGFGWIGGSGFNCSTNTTSPPCKYASLNGYTGSNVSVTFPSSLPGVTALPGTFSVTNPYILVTVTDPVQMSFSKLVSATSTVNISAKAGCGVNPVNLPIPMVILNQTQSGTLSQNGKATTQIIGGPKRSIQVDSKSTSAVSIAGKAGGIDLTQAGPSNTGADFGVTGTESQLGQISLGTGKWISPDVPFGDPFQSFSDPGKPGTLGQAFPVAFAVNGCPDPGGCVEFTGGDYSSCTNSVSYQGNGCPVSPSFSAPYGANWTASTLYNIGTLLVPATNNGNRYMFMATTKGTSGTVYPTWSSYNVNTTFTEGSVTWKNMGPISTSPSTAIFDSGLYYIGSTGLQPGSNTTVRMSTATGDGNFGATFYFSSGGSNTFSFGSNTGKSGRCGTVTAGTSSWSPTGCEVQYNISGGTTSGVPSLALACPGGSANPTSVPATMDGNILLGPCSGTYGGTGGLNRGFLFYQSRTAAGNASLGGGGSFIFSGNIYMHFGNGSSCGSTTSCLSLSGGSGGSSFTLGDIAADEVSLGGNSTITMILNPNFLVPILRPSLLE
jgi:hypothetical protein